MGTGAAVAQVGGALAVGFVGAVGAPVIGMVAGVIGIGLLVWNTYSDREQLHSDLLPYVWNLIDDTPPSLPLSVMENLETAAGIALGLMDDGPAQFKLMGQKLKAKEDAFEKFWAEELAPIINYFEKKATAEPNKTYIYYLIDAFTT